MNGSFGFGRSKIGSRVNVTVKAVRGKNYSICAAMNSDGLHYYMAQEVSFNTDHFIDFLNGFFSYLSESGFSDVTLIMDNVRFHHLTEVTELIAAKGAKILFLPAYSPFLNPIENMFNQLKHYIKKLKPETADQVFDAVSKASDAISPADCANYYRNMSKYLLRSLNREIIEN